MAMRGNPKSRNWSRRAFLQTAGLGLAGAGLVSCQAPQPAAPAPRPAAIPRPATGPRTSANSRLQHACIGVGGMGLVDLNNFVKSEKVQVVALCDVDRTFLQRAARMVPGARLYEDWRELLAREGPSLDALNVSVPDHMHFSIALSAIRQGLHVYCQEPLCHDVAEVRALTLEAGRRGVVTQLGIQAASSLQERTAVQWVREGRIGKVTRAYLCANRPGAVESYRLPGPRPQIGHPPPPELNWDFWIGTAPLRPYVPNLYHPIKWRAWQDFGTGWSGDIGCQLFSPVWRALDLSAANAVSAEVQPSWINSPERRGDTWPQANHITWTISGGPQVAGGELLLEWFDGEFFPPEHVRRIYSANVREYPPESVLLIGTEGSLLMPHGYPAQLLPAERFKAVEAPPLPPRDHYVHFIEACLGGEPTESNFALTGPMAECVLLGTVAVQCPGELLEWDQGQLRVPNYGPANHLLRRTYREGWRLPKSWGVA